MHVHRSDFSDIFPVLPERRLFDTGLTPDILICSAGFEDRTCNIFSRYLKEDRLRDTTVIVLRYPTNADENQRNLAVLANPSNRVKEVLEVKYERCAFRSELRK
jgi:hypothetical protein